MDRTGGNPKSPDEAIAWFVDNFIEQRFLIVVQKHEGRLDDNLDKERKRLAIERQRQKDCLRFIGRLTRSLTPLTFLVVLAGTTLIGGVFWGVNLPSKIACDRQASLCYWLRLEKETLFLEKS